MNQRRKRGWRPTPEMDAILIDSKVRMGERAGPGFFGWHLARLRAATGQTAEQQAASMGVTKRRLAALCMCRIPRADHHDVDLVAVARHLGIVFDDLDDLLWKAAALGTDQAGEATPTS